MDEARGKLLLPPISCFEVMSMVLANQWITLATATNYDTIVREHELKDMYKRQEDELASFQKRMALPDQLTLRHQDKRKLSLSSLKSEDRVKFSRKQSDSFSMTELKTTLKMLNGGSPKKHNRPYFSESFKQT